MRILLGPSLFEPDRFIPIQFQLEEEAEGIPLLQFANAYEKMPGGLFVWDFVRLHLHISPSWAVKDVDGAFVFDIRIEDLRRYSLGILRKQTHSYITERFPEWRQLNYYIFTQLLEEKARGVTLPEWKQNALSFLEQRLEYPWVIAAFQWLLQCVSIHGEKEIEIQNITDIERLSALSLVCLYPAFPIRRR